MKLYYGTEEVKTQEALFVFDDEPPRVFENKTYDFEFQTRIFTPEVIRALAAGNNPDWIIRGKRLPRKAKKALKKFVEGYFGYNPILVYSEMKGFTGTKRWPAKGWVTMDKDGYLGLWIRYPKPIKQTMNDCHTGLWTIPGLDTTTHFPLGKSREGDGFDCVSWKDDYPTPCKWWIEGNDLLGIRLLPELREILPF